MKKLFAFVFAALFSVSALTITSVAEFLPEEKENYNVVQIMTAENGGNGFTFYAQRNGGEEVLCTYEVGQWDSAFMISRIDDNPLNDISGTFWINDPKGADAYMIVSTAGGDLIVKYRSPVTGKITFNFEAALTEHTVVEGENGILLSVEKADGTKLCDDIDINAMGTQEWGNYKKSGNDALGKATFPIEQDEEITVRFSNNGDGSNDMAVVWWNIRYSKIGEIDTTASTELSVQNTENPDTGSPTGTGTVTEARTGTDTAPSENEKTNTAVIVIIAAVVAAAVSATVVFVVKTKKKK